MLVLVWNLLRST